MQKIKINLSDKWQTRPLVRGELNSECVKVTNIRPWAQDGARHPARLSDWPTISSNVALIDLDRLCIVKPQQ
jgi:hypothetical protein